MLKIDVVRSVAALRAAVRSRRAAGARIGLVPTMGALHQGHLELVKAARRGSDFVVATIFVNPLQFNPGEDLDSYPRDEATDLNLLAATGAELVFAPRVAEMYPKDFSTEVRVGGLTRHLDGPARPGHFEGVATVVTKLFHQGEPDLACFGEKDFQQLSRNRALSPAARAVAARLPAVMRETVARLAGGAAAAPILAEARAELLAAGFDRVDYVELCDEDTLAPVPAALPNARLFAAAHLGRTRLIDNWPVRR